MTLSGKSTLKDRNQVMKVTIKRAAVIASVVLGAAGGLIFADHPYWGSVLIVAGVAGAVYMYLSSERTQAENEDFFDATAKLMFGSGAGNPYTERIKQRTTKPGHSQNIFADLDKALSIDPNDADALSLYCISAVLHLCFRHLVSSSNDPAVSKECDRLGV
jgi:ABC-type Mn2+/Zn2+ transport system permease subunit